MKIIGFSGKKQSGKTTAVNDLQSKLSKYEQINFADCLKELVFRYFAAPTKEYEHTIYDPFETKESKQQKHLCGKTYRELLQIIGTNMFRGLWPDIWIENYKFRIRTESRPAARIILTTDIRFLNEVKCIQDLGGHVIRLLRCPFPEDKHESETALDWLDGAYFNPPESETVKAIYKNHCFDAFIDNREMSIEQQNEAVWKLIQERGWLKEQGQPKSTLLPKERNEE